MRKEMLIFLAVIYGVLAINTYSYGSGLKSDYITNNEKVIELEQRSEDQIVIKYRLHNGKRQYRRWNKTKKCWVDPKWIDL